MRVRSLSEADRAAWANYAQAIEPLPGHKRAEPPALDDFAPPPTPTPPTPTPRATSPGRLRSPAAPAIAIGTHPPGVERRPWERFRSGKLPAARRLDLHGHTAQRAFHALVAFLRAAHADRLRCVEVITGRGTYSSAGEAGGVIRREFALWLSLPDVRPFVLAAAHPHAANPGSVRLLLRRVR